MNHSRRRTWEHTAETVLLLGTSVLAAVAVLPKAGLPAWLPPLVIMIAGTVIGLSVWAASGRGAISFFCFFYGLYLGVWALWAEAVDVWHAAVVATWLIGMIICCPLAAHAMLGGRPTSAKPGEPKAIEGPDLEAEHAAEMAKFEHMFNQVGCNEVQVLELAEERPGRVLRLLLPRSGKVTLSTLEGASRQIEVILKLKPGAVEFRTGDHSGDIVMRLREREVLIDSPRLKKELYATTINDSFAIGVQEDGQPLLISLRELHMLIVGTTGSGKSNLINVILSQLSYCVDTIIWVIDMKGGRTAKPWLQAWTEGKADAPALDWVATTREEAAMMMMAFKTAIETRMNSGVGGSKITPTSGMPQIILICDETADLLGYLRGTRKEVGEEGTTNTQLIKLAEECAQKGRSEAASTLWATQRGTNDMAGSGTLKSLCKLRIALGVSTEGDLRWVIPDARLAQKQLAVIADNPGVGLAAVGRNASQLTKFFWHDHIEGECSEGGNDGCVQACPVYRTSVEVGKIRPRLDRMTADSLGDLYTTRWQRAEHLLRRPVPAGAGAVVADDVDMSQFDGIIKQFGNDPESPREIHPARKRAREILSSRGIMGATPKHLLEKLENESHHITRETLQRWLAQDEKDGILHNADRGRWVYGPAKGKNGQAA